MKMQKMDLGFDCFVSRFINFLHNFSYSEKKISNYGTGIMLVPSEIHMLMEIENNPEMNSKKLAEHLGITKGAVSQLSKRLIQKDLIRKSKGSNTGIEITELGKIALTNHKDSHIKLIEDLEVFWETLSLSQRNKFSEIIDTIEQKAMEV